MTTELETKAVSLRDNFSSSTRNELDWNEIERLGINKPAPEMTRWKAMQHYIGIRRGAIRFMDGLMITEGRTAPSYKSLLARRKELSRSQSLDRLRLKGKR